LFCKINQNFQNLSIFFTNLLFDQKFRTNINLTPILFFDQIFDFGRKNDLDFKP